MHYASILGGGLLKKRYVIVITTVAAIMKMKNTEAGFM